jgi:hypothetical protein
VYGKTFTTLWEGSMVGQADPQLVFIFLFCHCDRSGFVEAHPAIVSAKTGLPMARVKAALAFLEEPDPDSRSKAEDGRRIIPIEDDHVSGWKVVNYEYYRGLRRAEDRREYHRQYWHTRKLNHTQHSSTPPNPTQPIAYAEADVDAEKKDTGTASRSRFVPPTLEEVAAYCRERKNSINPGLWFDHYESNGWRVGRNPMKSWKAAVRTWEKSSILNREGAKPQIQGPASNYSALEKARKDREAWELEQREAQK